MRIYLFWVGLSAGSNAGSADSDYDDYYYEDSDDSEGVCLLSHNHKPVPSAEPQLSGECRQWRHNSCCSPG